MTELLLIPGSPHNIQHLLTHFPSCDTTSFSPIEKVDIYGCRIYLISSLLAGP